MANPDLLWKTGLTQAAEEVLQRIATKRRSEVGVGWAVSSHLCTHPARAVCDKHEKTECLICLIHTQISLLN